MFLVISFFITIVYKRSEKKLQERKDKAFSKRKKVSGHPNHLEWLLGLPVVFQIFLFFIFFLSSIYIFFYFFFNITNIILKISHQKRKKSFVVKLKQQKLDQIINVEKKLDDEINKWQK